MNKKDNLTELAIMRHWKDEIPVVSITCITYNHEKYIANTLDSLLSQKTNFAFELIVHDDASTDNTQEIIKAYHQRYPTIIKPILQTENYWLGKGINATTAIVWPSAKGKYIAWIEGDDYWIDENKLQKQYELLESNTDCLICYTNKAILYSEGKIEYPSKSGEIKKIGFEELVKINSIATLTVMFKNPYNFQLPQYFNTFKVCDWPLYLWLLKDGSKAIYLNEITAVYRHGIGLSASLRKKGSLVSNALLQILSEIYVDEKFYNFNKHIRIEIVKKHYELIANYLIEKDFIRLIKVLFLTSLKSNPFKVFKFFLYCLIKNLKKS